MIESNECKCKNQDKQATTVDLGAQIFVFFLILRIYNVLFV